MYKIALQAGHQNIRNNCNLNLRGGTGAPGEAEWTPRMRDALSQKLIAKGFQLFLFDANANCDVEAQQDFDLFLAIHYDADIYSGAGGGLAGAPDPSVDAVNSRSQAIARTINNIYFSQSGIAYHPERINGNMTFYYMWQNLTAKTPCVLIECGTNNRDNLQNRIDELSIILARAVSVAFDVPYDTIQTQDPKKILEQIARIVHRKGSPWTRIIEVQGLTKPFLSR